SQFFTFARKYSSQSWEPYHPRSLKDKTASNLASLLAAFFYLRPTYSAQRANLKNRRTYGWLFQSIDVGLLGLYSFIQLTLRLLFRSSE
ncbi:hypothetical protein, partial [Turicimonas muris]|uniref:hypothetical protein n=1 Tax=Turicimonas muris TaxID=1796652 RepID=UPI002494FBEA